MTNKTKHKREREREERERNRYYSKEQKLGKILPGRGSEILAGGRYEKDLCDSDIKQERNDLKGKGMLNSTKQYIVV